MAKIVQLKTTISVENRSGKKCYYKIYEGKKISSYNTCLSTIFRSSQSLPISKKGTKHNNYN